MKRGTREHSRMIEMFFIFTRVLVSYNTSTQMFKAHKSPTGTFSSMAKTSQISTLFSSFLLLFTLQVQVLCSQPLTWPESWAPGRGQISHVGCGLLGMGNSELADGRSLAFSLSTIQSSLIFKNSSNLQGMYFVVCQL